MAPFQRAGLAFLALVTVSCNGRDGEVQEVAIHPSAGAAVTLGRLAQLRGALGYLLATVRSQTEPEELLAPAAHLVAAFYGWPEPREREADLFIGRVCRERLRLASCRPWLQAVLSVLQTVARDGLSACSRLGFRDSYRRTLLERTCRTLGNQVPALERLLAWAASRWPHGMVPRVAACRRIAFRGPRVEFTPARLVVRGMEVLPLEEGRLSLGPEAAEALQAMLVAGAAGAETKDASPTGARQEGGEAASGTSLLVRVSSLVRNAELRKILRLAAEVNFRQVLFRVRGPDGGPCLLEATLSISPVPPKEPRCELVEGAVRLCEAGGRCRPDSAAACRPAYWVLRAGTAGQFLRALAKAGTRPVIWLGDVPSLTVPPAPRPGPARRAHLRPP